MSLLQILDGEQAPATMSVAQATPQPQLEDERATPAGDKYTPVFLGAVPCEHEAVDDLAGLLSAQRIYFALDVAQFPHRVRLMVLSFWWFQQPTETSLGVRLLAPGGEQMAALSDPAVVRKAPTFFSHRVRFADTGQETIALPNPGIYRVEIWAGPTQVGAYPLVVTESTANDS